MIILFPSAYAGVAEWQTQQTQNLPIAISCGFKSHLRHHIKTPIVSIEIYCLGFQFCLKFSSILFLVQHFCNTLNKNRSKQENTLFLFSQYLTFLLKRSKEGDILFVIFATYMFMLTCTEQEREYSPKDKVPRLPVHQNCMCHLRLVMAGSKLLESETPKAAENGLLNSHC